MNTLNRGAEGSKSVWLDDLLSFYQLRMEVDSGKGVVLLTDSKFFELNNKTIKIPVAKVMGIEEEQTKALLKSARYRLNRRARKQGITPTKRSQGVMST